MSNSKNTKQKSISSFFSPKILMANNENNRKRSSDINEEVQCPKTKLFKDDNETTVASSIESDQENLTIKNESLGDSWRIALQTEISKSYYIKLQEFVMHERTYFTIYPPPSQVYSWSHYCDISDIKVVILGQDPYHGPGQAHGLCFSVQKGVKPPPSLINIYKELKGDIDGFKIPEHGDLTAWTEQGVLLLNAVLTVRQSKANSHKDKGWEKFTDAVIAWLNKNLSEVVFMLWGSYAQKKGAKINTRDHLVLKSVHPSPLSVYRGFIGCKHFSKANDYLVEKNKTPINWNLL